MLDNPLPLLLKNPRTIAIAGASSNPMMMGTMQALSITTDGCQGKFYPVHPEEGFARIARSVAPATDHKKDF